MSGRALLTGPRAVPIAPLLSPTGPRDDPIRGADAAPMPPALGGRGIDRDPKPPAVRPALPTFGEAPRSGMRAVFPGVRTLLFCPGRAIPAFAPICGRSTLPRPATGLLRPVIDVLRPILGCVLRIPAISFRVPAAGVIWLTTGREKVLAGAAGPRPAPPAIVVRVGRTSGARTAAVLIRLNWFGAIRTEFRDTGNEFASVLREAAVNPFGARKFA